ncbi:MAG TPA: carbonic anhydrase [Bacilli bacterium]
MSIISDILAFNRQFVANKEYEPYRTTRFPNKKVVVISCMDTRLIELLPKAMNLKNGDAKFIKNAGAIVMQPFGNVMRSIIVAIYEMNAEEVIVVGHRQCGMTGLNSEAIVEKMKQRGIPAQTFRTLTHSGIDLHRWLTGFANVEDGVANSVRIIRNHPLLPANVQVHGMIIDPETGGLELIQKES